MSTILSAKDFLALLKSHLTTKHLNAVVSELHKTSNEELLKQCGLDIITEIGSFLREVGGDPPSTVIKLCKDAYRVLAENGNAKEVLMGLLEQLELGHSPVKFVVLLEPIQIVLLRMPTKRGQSLLCVLDMLHDAVRKLPIPRSYGLEGQERLLLDMDADVVNILNSLEQIVHFYEPFVKEVSRFAPKQSYQDRISGQRRILARFILKLFDVPLTFVDLNKPDAMPPSKLRTISEKLVANLYELDSNFYSFYRFATTLKGSGEGVLPSELECKVSNLALGTFSYLVHAEGVFISQLPCVYSYKYILEANLPFISALLRQPQECPIHKGLLLTDYILKFIPLQYYNNEFLELEEYVKLAQDLINVMTNCNVTELRRLAVSNFQNFIKKFDWYGRYRFLSQLFNSNKHSGVQGLLINCFKENVGAALQETPPIAWFVGSHLQQVLRIIFVLQGGAKTDLLEERDFILSALNLLRYLLIRDNSSENVTGVWTVLSVIQTSFLEPLQMAITLSRAHYQLELKNVRESKLSTTGSGASSSSTEMFEDGMPLTQKLHFLEMSITGIDLIQSVLSIVCDIVTSRKQDKL